MSQLNIEKKTANGGVHKYFPVLPNKYTQNKHLYNERESI
jgi:hypothetical protein